MDDASAMPHTPDFSVWHYDGASAVRRTPEMVVRADGFVLVEDGVAGAPIGWNQLVAQGVTRGEAVYEARQRGII